MMILPTIEFMILTLKNFDKVPMSKNKYFKIDAKILESNDDITFEVLLHRKDDKYNFVSSYLIDFNGNDKAYYGKDIKGLIVKDSIPQIPQLLIGDNIVSVDSISFNKTEDFLNAIKKIIKKRYYKISTFKIG